MPLHFVRPFVPCDVQPVPSHCWHIASAPTAWGCFRSVMRVCASLLPQFRVCLPRLPLMVMPSPSCFCRSYAVPRIFLLGHSFTCFKGMRGLPTSPCVLPAQYKPVRGPALSSVVRICPRGWRNVAPRAAPCHYTRCVIVEPSRTCIFSQSPGRHTCVSTSPIRDTAANSSSHTS